MRKQNPRLNEAGILLGELSKNYTLKVSKTFRVSKSHRGNPLERGVGIGGLPKWQAKGWRKNVSIRLNAAWVLEATSMAPPMELG